MAYCRYPEEVCCNMTLYGGKVYCDNINGFCHLHDELPPRTNADRIRAMSDEELANHLYLFHGLEERIKFCQNLPACEALLNTEDDVPEEKCVGCLLAWLKQPAE